MVNLMKGFEGMWFGRRKPPLEGAASNDDEVDPWEPPSSEPTPEDVVVNGHASEDDEDDSVTPDTGSVFDTEVPDTPDENVKTTFVPGRVATNMGASDTSQIVDKVTSENGGDVISSGDAVSPRPGVYGAPERAENIKAKNIPLWQTEDPIGRPVGPKRNGGRKPRNKHNKGGESIRHGGD